MRQEKAIGYTQIVSNKSDRRDGKGVEVVFLHEALKSRTREKPYITRLGWQYITDQPTAAAVKILATDSPDCCIIMSVAGKNPCRGWQPTAGDLMADDWVISK